LKGPVRQHHHQWCIPFASKRSSARAVGPARSLGGWSDLGPPG
jgi:hypothetical protein